MKEDPRKWERKVSKYDLDRGTVDLKKLERERIEERGKETKAINEIVKRETEKAKKEKAE